MISGGRNLPSLPGTADGTTPIADVSRLLQVPMPTLRSWELRYDIPSRTQTSGQHRRYTPQQMQALRMMRDEIARGRRAGDAARSVRVLSARQGRPPI